MPYMGGFLNTLSQESATEAAGARRDQLSRPKPKSGTAGGRPMCCLVFLRPPAGRLSPRGRRGCRCRRRTMFGWRAPPPLEGGGGGCPVRRGGNGSTDRPSGILMAKGVHSKSTGFVIDDGKGKHGFGLRRCPATSSRAARGSPAGPADETAAGNGRADADRLTTPGSA